MLRSKVFVKKSKRGKILKIVREHYLRDDIWCGSEICDSCEHSSTVLEEVPNASINSSLCSDKHYILPDTNVLLHQIDVMEHSTITNVIILQTVLNELKHCSAPVFKRVKDCLGDSGKHFYTFVNEFHKDTFVEREPGETANDHNDRAIRTSAKWYQKHLDLNKKQDKIHVLFLTNDADNRTKAKAEGIKAHTIHEYVKSLGNNSELVDKLASVPDQASVQKDKSVFPEHLPLSEIQRGLKSGKYLQGTFQASRENYLEGNCSVKDQEDWVFIQGLEHINRAVQDDIVAIEMLPESEWTCPSSLVMVDEEEKADDEDTQKEDSTVAPKKVVEKRPTGKVVGIIKRNWRQYCGILQKSLIKGANRHLFKPAEKRIPKIRIETRQADVLEGQRIVVAIDSWPRTSRYPQGHFVRKLGAVGDKATENEVLLLEHDVPHSKFSEAVMSCLPSLPWIITDEDLKRRTDLRHIDICSVDPPGCTDIDDALHCRVLENGNYEVGVHIADVSHFIRPGTAIDREAANRGTTVYLIDKRIDMVPELLSSNLCSLRGGEERFAFSVLWEMTKDATVINRSYTKSVIKSRAALTYAEAQMRIDDPSLKDEITESLRRLNSLAKILKKRRIDNGALSLASPEIRFHIDSETHDPIDVQSKELRETNSMVEEFMLLANIATAEKTLDEFSDGALLRRHPSPPVNNFDPLIKAAEAKGFKMNVGTGKDLADSLDDAIMEDHPYFNTMLRILATRCMMQAVYFCSGMVSKNDYPHYGLATPIYTHFTSPIRRYSDLLVHRLLSVSIGADASYPELLDKKKTQALCNNLNYRHKMAQYAGRASVSLHTQLFFKSRVLDQEAYILFVRKNAIQVLIPKFGLEGTIFVADTKGKSMFTYKEDDNTLSCKGVTLRVFDPVMVQLSLDKSDIQHQKLSLKLVQPEIEGFSVPVLNSSNQSTGSEENDEPPTKKLKKKKDKQS